MLADPPLPYYLSMDMYHTMADSTHFRATTVTQKVKREETKRMKRMKRLFVANLV